MNILAIDTAALSCSAMIRLTGGAEFFRAEDAAQHHSRHILRLIDELVAAASIQLEDLHLITWNAGPGSFTGLRIGASVVQALAYSLGVPVLPLSSLEVLAHVVMPIEQPSNIAVAMDARMNGFYYASFTSQQGQLQRIETDQLLDKNILEERESLCNVERLAVGDGWTLVSHSMKHIAADVSAADVMELAVTKNREEWLNNPADCLPNYVQTSINWQKRRSRVVF